MDECGSDPRDEGHLACLCAYSSGNVLMGYCIAGNFRMVQNFAVFVDRTAAAKIRTTKFSSASYVLLVGVVSPEC